MNIQIKEQIYTYTHRHINTVVISSETNINKHEIYIMI